MIKQIREAERQLKSTKDSTEDCLISLQHQIRDLESEESQNVMLQERGLGSTQRTPHQSENYTGAGAAAGTFLGVGAGALLGAGAAGAGGLLAGSVLLGNSTIVLLYIRVFYISEGIRFL